MINLKPPSYSQIQFSQSRSVFYCNDIWSIEQLNWLTEMVEKSCFWSDLNPRPSLSVLNWPSILNVVTIQTLSLLRTLKKIASEVGVGLVIQPFHTSFLIMKAILIVTRKRLFISLPLFFPQLFSWALWF